MFQNLIESSSHRAELERRGSFLAFTTAVYALLFVVAGVASIFAYNPRLDKQNTDLTILTFAPVKQPESVQPSTPDSGAPRSGSTSNTNTSRPIRTVLYDSVNNPTNPPANINTSALSVPPAPPNAVLGNINVDPRGRPGGDGSSNSSDVNIARAVDEAGAPPPAPPKPTPPKVVRISTVLNSRALDLPRPIYPPIAKVGGVEGVVSIQVLIDEEGKVVSAKVLSGNPMLIHEAQRAAYRARFSATTIDGQPVKVSGVITYNFILQR
jgi:periplasmic protein TonB